MNTILMTVLIILAYMLNIYEGYLGAILMGSVVFKNIILKNDFTFTNIFYHIILSLPLSFIGVFGMDMHQMFSWYNILLTFLIIVLMIKRNGKLNIGSGALTSFFLITYILILNLFWSNAVNDDFQEIIQIIVMILPVLIFHGERKRIEVSKSEVESLILTYGNVCTATALTMLIQFFTFVFMHRIIGNILFAGGGRIQCYVLFKGASILPIFMGVGLIIYFIQLMEGRRIATSIINILLVFIAMVLNSSRTGMLMVVIILGIICVIKIIEKPSFGKVLVILCGLTGVTYGIDYMLSQRSSLDGFLDANGRFLTWINGVSIWTYSIKNFVIGEGFVGGMWTGITKTHNFVIQTLAQCGIIICTIILLLFTIYFWVNRKNKYIYTSLFLFLSGMLVTDFYANAFTTVCIVIVDIYGAKMHEA